MKSPRECKTLKEIDDLIEETGRHMPQLEAEARSRNWSAAERAANFKIDAMCRALERRAELAAGGVHNHPGDCTTAQP
jgi:hypothetical protein